MIGPHIQHPTPAALAWASRAPLVKALDDPAPLAVARPDVRLIFRAVLNDWGAMLDNPTTFYQTTLARLGSFRSIGRLYVELLNEVPPTETARYIAFARAVVPLFHAEGLLVVGPNFATGDYGETEWNAWRAGGWAGINWIGVHAYWSLLGPTPWNGYRWRAYWNRALDGRELLVSECGHDRVRDGADLKIDGGYIGKGGWKADGLTIEQAAKELNDYGASFRTGESAVAFTAGAYPSQAQYDLDDVAPLILSSGEVTPVPTSTGVKMTAGIDVSNHQGVIDWPLVARSAIDFAMIKASEGLDYTDPFFAANWAQSKAAGLVRGAYHFGRPSRAAGHAEAEFFLSKIPDLAPGDLLALDLEDDAVASNADLLAYALDFLRTVEQIVGFKPLLYSGHYYLAPHNCEGSADLGQYGLWLASYQDQPPPAPNGWAFWAIWQHSDAGHVPGIGKCDLDLYQGPIETLRKYGKP